MSKPDMPWSDLHMNAGQDFATHRRRGLRVAFALIAWGFGLPTATAQTVSDQTELNVSPGGQRAPALSWDTANNVYVMVWQDRRNAANGDDLYVARIGPDGTLRDATGIPLISAAEQVGNEIEPTIAFNETSGTHVIAWNEARTGRAEIYVSRFLAGSGTILPTNGNQVNGGGGAIALPDVAAGSVSNFITFRSVSGGINIVRGIRLSTTLEPIDAQPILVSSEGNRPSALFLGNEFAVAYQSQGDILLRTYPGFGSTSSVAPAITVSTSTNSETQARLGRAGPNAFAAVWQDTRAGASPVAYYRQYSNAVAPLRPDTAVQNVTTSQLTPRIAGDDNGALVVWQDRRNSTTNSIIYGARMDNNGAIQDPDGFPLLILSASAFEQTVVKGPGRDYLVAAVRSDASTPRIFYRIMRDEAPDGPLMFMGPASVPADGAAVADLVFGRATGPADANGDRLTVVNGTQYDLTVSSNAPTILTPDVNPNRPGHQVAAFGGNILVQLQSTTREMVDVMVSSVDGNSSGMTTLTFLNVAPVASNVAIGPPMPRSDEPLRLTYDFFDVNGDTDVGTVFQWINNTQVVDTSTLADPTRLPASFTIRGEMWSVRVTPGDGLDLGTAVRSNTLIIGNTPPRIIDLELREESPDGMVIANDPLQLRFNFRDVDGDAQGPLTEIRWLDNGVEQVDLRNALGVPGDRVVKGQQWEVTILPHDTIEFGNLVTSNSVVVGNTDPVANAGEDGTVLERRRISLDGTASSDVDTVRSPIYGYPPDVLTYRWRQDIRGTEPEVQLSSTSSPTPSFIAPSVEIGTTLFFGLVVNDGTVDSTEDFTVVTVTAVPDQDNDRLDDEEEAEAGTDPESGDSDRDGLTDFQELRESFTDPLDQDTDDDGVRDGREGRTSRNSDDEDPLGDVDDDQIINALDPDSDNDGISDGTELGIDQPLLGGGTAPFTYEGTNEAAGNFVADADDQTTTNPVDADSDDDSFLDGEEDTNANGRVDSGESDPNDPLDPGTPCTMGGNECPAPLECIAGFCAEPGTTPPMCNPLSDLNLECCAGGCINGTLADPVCRREGADEQCPVGADRCVIGSCSTPPPIEGGGGGGCSCTTGEQRPTPALWAGLLLAGLLFGRRRWS